MSKIIVVQRDVQAVLIPSGHLFDLKAGTPVRMMQALGGNYSVEVFGNMVMVQTQDADALGFEIDASISEFLQSDLSVEEKAIRQLKACYDPEIPVNIYDLGLIYNVSVVKETVMVTMTLTSPTCGMGPYIVDEVKRKLHQIPGVSSVEVSLVFDPPWDKAKLSPEAKLQLNIF